MATKELESIDNKQQVEIEDITRCCICTEVYTDPKALPCIHTFCMKCIQETGLKTNKGPGDEMPCPICRRLFKIPSDGFPGLPKHFFIERLIQVSKVTYSSTETKCLCYLCQEECKEQEGRVTPTADTFCVDCKYTLCEECCSEHKLFRATRNHKLIPINEYENDQNAIIAVAQIFCEAHEQNILNVYCVDCKIVVCAICFIEEHQNHKGSHVNKHVDGFLKQIKSSTETLTGCIAQAQYKKAELLMMKEQMQKLVGCLECDIKNRTEQIRQLADKHMNSLLQSLNSERQSRFKEIQMATDDIDVYLSNLESYNAYCRRIIAKGSASDICSAIYDLSTRATELQQHCQPIIEREIQEFKVCFRQSELEELLEDDSDNLIGEINKESDFRPKKRSKQIQLAEQCKEIDVLRQKTEKMREERALYKAHIERLKQELETNKTEIQELHASNDILRVKLDTEKTTKDALTTSNDKLMDELSMYRITVKTLEAKAKKHMEGQVEHRYKAYPYLIKTIKTKGAAKEYNTCICGLTILDKEMFVASESGQAVEVYDSLSFIFSRQWNLKRLFQSTMDMGSCSRNKCLFFFVRQPSEILRVDPNGKLINKWPTEGDSCGGLSVTDESNVIITLLNKNKLIEYSSDGQLIREIKLSTDLSIRQPWHAIKLSNGNFVVSHGYHDEELHRVCLVDADGRLEKSFGGKCGSTTGQLNRPGYLSVDRNGFVLVADSSRVLLLDSELNLRSNIPSSDGTHGSLSPCRIALDKSNDRLFVADSQWKKSRILIVDY